MPTPDQLSSFSSTMHSGETKKRSNQAETDRRFAVPYIRTYVQLKYRIYRNEIIQDLLERKRKELSGSLLASYFYNCKCMQVYLYTPVTTMPPPQGYHTVDTALTFKRMSLICCQQILHIN